MRSVLSILLRVAAISSIIAKVVPPIVEAIEDIVDSLESDQGEIEEGKSQES